MFLQKIIPQDKVFFDLFRQLAGCVRDAAERLAQCVENEVPLPAIAGELKRIEHRADDLTHELLGRMERTFVTPFDREDIHTLADRLDDIVDRTEEVGKLAAVYGIERLTGRTAEMSRILARACGQVARAVEALPAAGPILEASRGIKAVETEGDALYYEALGELFQNEREPLEVMKWKDIINQLENAIDACEHAAGTLEGIALKHG